MKKLINKIKYHWFKFKLGRRAHTGHKERKWSYLPAFGRCREANRFICVSVNQLWNGWPTLGIDNIPAACDLIPKAARRFDRTKEYVNFVTRSQMKLPKSYKKKQPTDTTAKKAGVFRNEKRNIGMYAQVRDEGYNYAYRGKGPLCF